MRCTDFPEPILKLNVCLWCSCQSTTDHYVWSRIILWVVFQLDSKITTQREDIWLVFAPDCDSQSGGQPKADTFMGVVYYALDQDYVDYKETD